MKTPPRILLLSLLLFAALTSAIAGAEKQDDGTYLLTGTWTFWADKDLLAPTGKTDLGEFKAILFKAAVNEFAGVREMKKTTASFKVKARESVSSGGDKILVVEEILERVE